MRAAATQNTLSTMSPLDRAILSKSRLFRNISLESIDYLLDACPVVDFPAGSDLLAPGKPNSNLYLVLAGTLKRASRR